MTGFSKSFDWPIVGLGDGREMLVAGPTVLSLSPAALEMTSSLVVGTIGFVAGGAGLAGGTADLVAATIGLGVEATVEQPLDFNGVACSAGLADTRPRALVILSFAHVEAVVTVVPVISMIIDLVLGGTFGEDTRVLPDCCFLKSAATGVDFLGVTPGADFVTLPPITNKGSGGSVLALGGLEAFFSGSLVVSLMVAGGLMG